MKNERTIARFALFPTVVEGKMRGNKVIILWEWYLAIQRTREIAILGGVDKEWYTYRKKSI